MKKYRTLALMFLLFLAFLVAIYIVLRKLDSQSAEFQIILQGISVFLFGGIVAYIIETQNRKYEQTQQTQTSNLSRLRYLRGIRMEIKSILKPFNYFELFFFDKEKAEDMFDKGEQIPGIAESIHSIQDISKTTYWDALVPSGLLPSVVSPELLSKISDFYHLLRVLIRVIDDFKSELQQDELTSASRGISLKVHNLFLGETISGFSKNTFMPILKDLTGKGREILPALDSEIGYLEKLEGFSELENEFIIPKDDEKTTHFFTDITLVNLNEYRTTQKEGGNSNNRAHYDIEDEDDNDDLDNINDSNTTNKDPEYVFCLRLSSTPPSDWGNSVKYREPKHRQSWEAPYRYEAEIKGRYLIFEGRKQELLDNLPNIVSAIANMNKKYRSKLLAKQKNAQIELNEKEKSKWMIANIKSEIDKEIS